LPLAREKKPPRYYIGEGKKSIRGCMQARMIKLKETRNNNNIIIINRSRMMEIVILVCWVWNRDKG
jgi:hypothetical protein